MLAGLRMLVATHQRRSAATRVRQPAVWSALDQNLLLFRIVPAGPSTSTSVIHTHTYIRYRFQFMSTVRLGVRNWHKANSPTHARFGAVGRKQHQQRELMSDSCFSVHTLQTHKHTNTDTYTQQVTHCELSFRFH